MDRYYNTALVRKDTRIGIVGGGASGLSAAYLLKKAGYRNVTVFEKEQRVGGKCRTVFVDDQSYELGAVMHLQGCEPVESFIREFRVEMLNGIVQPPPRRQSYLFDPKRNRHFRYPRLPWVWLAAIRFSLLSKRRPEIICEGHENMAADLAMPLSAWLSANRLDTLELLFACWISGFGYGYAARIPAAYALKLCTPRMVWSILLGGPRIFKNGYQDLWDRIGAVLDLRLNHPVHRITRGDRVQIATEGGEFEFDKVILCCDLRDIAAALDADDEEGELIGRIRSVRYHSIIAEAEGFPSGIVFVPAHFNEQSAGAPVCWYNRWSEKKLFNFYAITDEEMSEEQVQEKIAETASQVGGKLVRVVSSKNWNYFPFVSCDDLKAGFYRRLEARQGRRNTYYAGEIMHFACVDLLAAYSAQLVTRHFT